MQGIVNLSIDTLSVPDGAAAAVLAAYQVAVCVAAMGVVRIVRSST